MKKSITTLVMFSLLMSTLPVQAGDFEHIKELLETANNLYQESKYQSAYYMYKAFFDTVQNTSSVIVSGKLINMSLCGIKADFYTDQEKAILDYLTPQRYFEAHVNCGNVSAALKKWEDALDHWKWKINEGKFGRVCLKKEWDYSEPRDKKIVVYSEHDNDAFGDTFIMLKLLKLLKSQGAHVIFVPQKPLQKICELQTESIDQVVLRGQDIPEHDAATYLWSILHYVYNNHFSNMPLKPGFKEELKPSMYGIWWISTATTQYAVQAPSLRPQLQELFEKYKDKLLVGFWYRGSGPTTLATDNRSLYRDLGANVIMKTLGGLDNVALVCLEGMGHYPIKKTKYLALKNNNEQLDEIDIIDDTVDASNLVLMPNDFDKTSGAFVDTCSVMRYIKEQSGYLVGCDTSSLMAAAGIKGKEKLEKYKYQTLALTNEKRDCRWGVTQERIAESTVRQPKSWSLSQDVLVFQNLEQNNWENSLQQVKDYITQ